MKLRRWLIAAIAKERLPAGRDRDFLRPLGGGERCDVLRYLNFKHETVRPVRPEPAVALRPVIQYKTPHNRRL